MKVTMDGRQAAAAYGRAFQRLKELPGFDHRETLRAEAGSILKTWAGRTKVATQEQTDRRSRLALVKHFGLSGGSGRPVSINAGIRGDAGRIWLRTRNKKFQFAGQADLKTGAARFTNYHYRAADWQEIVQATNDFRGNLAAYITRGRQTIGLSRQSVIQIADDLGIDLTQVQGQGVSAAGIAKARAAIASNGRSYRNGFGTQGGDQVKFYVNLLNRLPYGQKIGMDRTLAGVLSGRAKYIETSYAKGAFDSIKRAQRAFPNILTVSANALAA